MTYKQKFEALQKDLAEKTEKYLLADKELWQIDGYVDHELNDYAMARMEFEAASDIYHNFVEAFKKSGKSPLDEYEEV